MRRRAEYLVEKRDGRREWLRATKLARSLLLALNGGSGRSDPERAALALRLSSSVLAAVRGRSSAEAAAATPAPRSGLLPEGRCAGLLSTAAIAAAATHVLLAAGHPHAAQRYVAVGTERRRRAAVLADLRSDPPASPAADRLPPPGNADASRW